MRLELALCLQRKAFSAVWHYSFHPFFPKNIIFPGKIYYFKAQVPNYNQMSKYECT